MAALIPALRSFTRGLCGRLDAADELAQDAMIGGWAHRSQFTPGTDFRAWMFKIVRSQFYALLRWDQKWGSRTPNLLPSPARDAAADSQAGGILRNLQHLTPELRETLLLVGANAMSFDQAAEIMDCSIGTASNRYLRGHDALALILGEQSAIALPDVTP